MHRLFVAAALVLACWSSLRAQPADADPAASLLAALEAAVATGSTQALAELAAPDLDPSVLREFTERWLHAETTRATILERDRQPLDDGAVRLLAEVLLETTRGARLATWQLDVVIHDDEPRIDGIHVLGMVEGLHRLELDTSRQYRATNLRIVGEDLELLLPSGAVFAAEAGGGMTALVLVGRGTMVFHPAPETERGQLRLFAGSETLRAEFRAAFIRLNPSDVAARLDRSALTEVPPDPRAVRTALAVFRDHLPRSYSLDLGDLSPDLWAIVPTTGDILADVRTRRHGTLTYAQAASEPEDVTLFDRDRRRNIAVYASRARLAARGPFYSEDDQAELDVQAYHVDVSFTPDRLWFEGRSRLVVRTRAHALTSVRLRLASSLQVQSVHSDRFGRLLFLRVRNQDSLIVNLPATVLRDTDLALTVVYAGRLDPQEIDREALQISQRAPRDDAPLIEPETSFLYSNRSYWYPQPSFTDYGTATIRFTVPSAFGAVCSGEPAEGSPVAVRTGVGPPRLLHVFTAAQPVRYLSCVVSRLTPGGTRVVTLDDAEAPHATNGSGPEEVRLAVHTTARMRSRGREMLDRAADVVAFYAGLVGEAPFPTFSLVVLESHIPGGHSPAYFAALNQPLPTSPFTWRDDPASFENYPEFFLAHEIAHQWWGQGVGWKNYREQWLSEGFAQYFAALYAEHHRGPDVFAGVIRSMSRWAVSASPQGPVYLGYRLGHLRNDGRVYRALVYNKGAMVLHTMRRLAGDETFFRALRRFYATHRFTKAGTDDLRQAFEAETGRDWSAFFEQWIYGSELPRLSSTSRVQDADGDRRVVVRLEQPDRVFEFPVTVTVQFTDGTTRDEVVAVRAASVEHVIPVDRPVRAVHVNRDRGAMLRE
jgi:hypothetical protein